jgi:predicted regulator of Ras-like GTPase activity (Roadblock/LC7/MglB family)
MSIGETLEHLARSLQGCDAVAVVGMDGMAIDQRSGSRAPDLDLISVGQTSLLKGALAARSEARSGEPSELILLTDRHQFIARLLGQDYFLLLILQPGVSLGRARFEARRAGLLLEEELR